MYRFVSCHVLSFPVASFRVLSCLAIPRHVVSYVSRPVMSCHFLSRRIVSFHVMSCHVMSGTTSLTVQQRQHLYLIHHSCRLFPSHALFLQTARKARVSYMDLVHVQENISVDSQHVTNSSYSHNSMLRVDTVVEDKLAFKLVKTTGHCSTVYRKFLQVLDFLVLQHLPTYWSPKEH